MKKLLLTIALTGSALLSQAQVIFAVQSPASIAGNYDFSWADPAGGWGTPNFLIPGTFVQGDIQIADDGTVPSDSVNAQGNSANASGCNAFPAGSLAGKIAVVYRYDGVSVGSCEFGVKALNAQNAGAIGVIIVNRETGVIQMGPGASGASVTIPVAMISLQDGDLLKAELANGPVNVFIGNKTGLFNDDGGLKASSNLISKAAAVPSQLALDGTEYSFDLGTRVFNYGLNDQNNIMVTATVDGPSGNVYSNTVGPISIPAGPTGDSIDIIPGGAYEFPPFSLASYPAGRYTVTYTVDLGTTDEYDADNTFSSDFVINDQIYSLANLGLTSNVPEATNGYRPSASTGSFSECIVFSNPNASRLGVDGLYFSAAGSAIDLTGEEMSLHLYRWDDVFTDLNDANLGFTALTEVASGFYYYPGDYQDSTVYGPFSSQVILEDNARYLACVQTFNLDLYLGFDTKTNYVWNEAYYLQPLTPIEDNGTWYASGFGTDVVPSVGMRIFPAAELGLNDEATVVGSAYPNPATDMITVSVGTNGTAALQITDLAGRTVKSTSITLVNGKASLNISDLNSGAYIFNITLADGKTSQFNVVKK